ncbi:MAG: hypothetical protein OEM16_10965, partial [Myxococcales bacterium]|nr:hypothetical protein [Myxococcales bacterium]
NAPVEPTEPAPVEEPKPPRKTKRRAAVEATPTQIEPAFVSVNSDPWSYVVIDGERIKATPLRGHRITPGRHQIVLRNPEAGLERRFEIEVKPGESKRLSVDLRGNP